MYFPSRSGNLIKVDPSLQTEIYQHTRISVQMVFLDTFIIECLHPNHQISLIVPTVVLVPPSAIKTLLNVSCQLYLLNLTMNSFWGRFVFSVWSIDSAVSVVTDIVPVFHICMTTRGKVSQPQQRQKMASVFQN